MNYKEALEQLEREIGKDGVLHWIAISNVLTLVDKEVYEALIEKMNLERKITQNYYTNHQEKNENYKYKY